MKKIILAVIAASMLLTNVVFASTNTKHNIVSNADKNNVLHLDTQDGH